MKIIKINFSVFFLLLLGLQCTSFGAEVAPLDKFAWLLKSDFVGDPSARQQLAMDNARTLDIDGKFGPDSRRIVFELDSDPIRIATNWRIDRSSVSCTSNSCVIDANFQVIAVTKGYGMPTWDRPSGREIILLPASKSVTVHYTFERTKQGWKIARFPSPFVQAAVLKAFFESEIKAEEQSGSATARQPIALKNQQIIREWYDRQRRVLQDAQNAK